MTQVSSGKEKVKEKEQLRKLLENNKPGTLFRYWGLFSHVTDIHQ